ncbi:condensation domain-containing protein [Streptomyces sp. NPDC001508]|uniref:condensation domain-containing protein n=1 Tax=Streptomyces sp. NPDC001508 TaxID=3154656 RepID=UPI003326AF14
MDWTRKRGTETGAAVAGQRPGARDQGQGTSGAASLAAAPGPSRQPVAAEAVTRVPAGIAQGRFWTLEHTDPDQASLHLSGLLRFVGTGWQPERIAANIVRLIEEQPSLRTVFEETDGELWQLVLPTMAPPFQVVQLRAPSDASEERMAEAVETARRLADEPFDLRRGPLFRVAMLVVDPDEFFLLVTLHHLISDGYSISLVGHAAMLGTSGPLQYTYLDHAERQRATLAAGGYAKEVEHWRELLRDAPPVTTFPPARPRPATWRPEGTVLTDRVDPEVTRRVHALAARSRRSPGAIMVACYLIVLAGWSGQRDVVTATVTLGRSAPGSDKAIGVFRNFAPLRWSGAGEGRFTDVLEHAQRALYDAADNSEMPIAALTAALEPDPPTDRSPVFQTLINLLMVDDEDYCLPPPRRLTSCTLDMILHVEKWFGTYYLNWMYPRSLFDADSVAEFNATFQTVLRQAVATPDIPTERLLTLVREAAHDSRAKAPRS